MSRGFERGALVGGFGAVSAALAVGVPCSGAIIPPGLAARAESLEWQSPWTGIGEQDIDTGAWVGPGRGAEAYASMTPSGETSAVSFAHYGFLASTASTVGSYSVPAGYKGYAQAITNTSFRDDQVVVSSTTVADGQAGTLLAEYSFDQIIDFDLTSLAGFSGDAVIVGGYSVDLIIGSHTASYTGTWTYDAVTGILVEPSLPMGVIQVSVPFTYGVPFTIACGVEMKLTTYLEGPASASADVEFSLGPSFIWQGITDGLPDDATASSPSVPDWRSPYGIPAPGVGAVALLTAAGAAARRMRR